MKLRLLLTAIILSLSFTASAETFYLNHGLVKLKLTASAQDKNYSLGISRTNQTVTTTNIVSTYKSTVTNTVFEADGILALLENSLDTDFPAGSQLAMARFDNYLSFFVADSTGSNILFDLATNFWVGTMFGAPVLNSGVEMVTTKTSDNGETVSGTDAETFSSIAILGYDDNALTTRDGTHTHFQVQCLETRKSSYNLGTQQIRDSIKLVGAGFGTISDKEVLLEGSVSANLTGVQIPPP